MSLRKFMHPRNKYKVQPDFKQLAILYPEFRNFAITDLTGKVKVDFSNKEAVRVLTEVLLKHDFNLRVKIPPDKLVPTLPLRLNYICWIEDLMKHASLEEMDKLTGIDIGTGAVCIYPLLLAKIYGCRMIATEIDQTSIDSSIEQIENNNLGHLIKVFKADDQTILKDVLEEQNVCHFTMCNPPFFETEGTTQPVVKVLPPRNAPTGTRGELAIEGGERMFVTKMIEESVETKDKVTIYTTMLGRKSNLIFVLTLLKKKNIENLMWAEFCQGYTKRWGLAWSFLPKEVVDLKTAPAIRKNISKLLNSQKSTKIVFPMRGKFDSFDRVIDRLQQSVSDLNMEMLDLRLPIEYFNGWACQLTAAKDTWTHTRRKRRLEQRLRREEIATEHSETRKDSSSALIEQQQEEEEEEEEDERNKSYGGKAAFLECSLYAQLVNRDKTTSESDELIITMILEKGTGGRMALETFRQYLINRLDVRECLQAQASKRYSKKRKRLKKNKVIDDPTNVNPRSDSCSSVNQETVESA